MNRRNLFLAAVILFIFSASSASAGYMLEFRKATERGRGYNLMSFDADLIWNATFFSDRFRDAFIEKHIELHHLTPAETEQFRAEQDYEQSHGWDFFIGFYTKGEFKHFTNEPDSFWKIVLTTESGEQVKPASVEMIPVTPYEKVMFPYLNRWSKAYRVTFPKVELGKKFELFLHSVVTDSTLKWKIK